MENLIAVINLICHTISWFFWNINTFCCRGDIFYCTGLDTLCYNTQNGLNIGNQGLFLAVYCVW